MVFKNSFIFLNNIPCNNSYLRFYNSSGILVKKISVTGNEIFISPEIFNTSGEYFIQLESENSYSLIQKIIVL